MTLVTAGEQGLSDLITIKANWCPRVSPVNRLRRPSLDQLYSHPLWPRMPPPNLNVDPEAQTDVQERQVDDTSEKQRGHNAKTQSTGMSIHFFLATPSPHLLAFS